MDVMDISLLILVFTASAGLVLLVGQVAARPALGKRAKRLLDGDSTAPKKVSWIERLAHSTRTLARLSREENGENSALRRRLFNAGIRHPMGPTAFFGSKTLLAVATPPLALALLSLSQKPLQGYSLMAVLLSVAALGYYLPNMVLARLVSLRQREIFDAFPDALDFMIICVEAGLGIEAALQRVSEDMEHRSRVLAEELQLLGLELRAGAPRERALHNLSLRTGVEEVDGFVSMLIQAERFGTSIAQALRVHADMLRTRRRQRAEETAARVATKLLAPLVFCILPSLLLVMLGPAMLRIMATLPTMMGRGL
jgi:tight adherence protein C